MPSGNERFKDNRCRVTRVCVDSYEGDVFAGRFYNPGSAHKYVFRSLSQFLVQMEDLLDQMDFPQAFSTVRTFSPRTAEAGGIETVVTEKETGKLATFVVRILFRQNASWQGSLIWEDEDREENFRSVLELILLMDSALKSKRA